MTSRARPLRRIGRIARYLVEDVIGALADLGYGIRGALRRRWRKTVTERRIPH
jgi:hypothetical protein